MISERIQKVLADIEAAKMRRALAPKDAPVELVAVTKNHGVDAMRAAIDAGVTDVGENRVQEAMEKHRTLGRTARWHLIGHLQTNKAKQAVEIFDLIHSVDSVRLAQAVNRAADAMGKVQDILLQVNLAREEQKSGICREELPELVGEVRGLSCLRLRGLMFIAPDFEDRELCRPLFREMHDIFLSLRQDHAGEGVDFLSMGMTHDYRIAVEEGANIVRVGTAIFGERV